jgi:hypothetical protein
MDTYKSGDTRTCDRCGRRRRTRHQSKLCWDCRYASSGPLPLMVDEPTPCHMDPDFFALERAIEEIVAEPGVVASQTQVADIAAYVEQKADPFCGECPHRAECLERMLGGKYTGIAGGRLLINGRVRARKRRPEVAA